MKPQENTDDQNQNDPVCSVPELLVRVSEEMSGLAQSCTEIQWVISTLLETAHHPDLASELHMLQDIDRMQQTLTDLATIVETLAIPVQGSQIRVTEVYNSMRLDSVKEKLLGTQLPDDALQQVQAKDEADITWL
ncbi:MAG TPA: hypothetical protein ENK28_11295 [Aliiroseovarius sp.]|nr:hypothetical protein [Aliiroseovarius sp.]